MKIYTDQTPSIPVWLVKREVRAVKIVTQSDPSVKAGAYCFSFEVPSEVNLVCLVSEPSIEFWDEMEDQGQMDDGRFDKKKDWLLVQCKYAIESTIFDGFFLVKKTLRGSIMDVSLISFDGLTTTEVERARELNQLIVSLQGIDYAPSYEVSL